MAGNVLQGLLAGQAQHAGDPGEYQVIFDTNEFAGLFCPWVELRAAVDIRQHSARWKI
ncbi:MAG: hypothetical protein ACLQBD_18990 [Syntrophobacteraceae bacterium]